MNDSQTFVIDNDLQSSGVNKKDPSGRDPGPKSFKEFKLHYIWLFDFRKNN